MKTYSIFFSEKAEKDFIQFQKSGNNAILKKILSLIDSIEQDPYCGIGKPEALKYNYSNYWSRRIDKEHRVIYKVIAQDKAVRIISLKGHYEK